MRKGTHAVGRTVPAEWRVLGILALVFWGSAVFLGACRQDEVGEAAPAASRGGNSKLTVAAAADLRFALDALLTSFHRASPDIRVVVTYGSSGNFYTQIVHGAPFDLYLSADLAYPRKLIEAGLAEATTEFRYALGFIVMWVPVESVLDPAKDQWKTLTHPSVRKIAVANPAHAPYGRAAEAAMRSAGVYDSIRDRLVFAENIAQAAQFVESGAAEVGIIALSLALAPTMRNRGRYWEIPADSYPQIEQGGVILTRTKEPLAARALREFLVGSEGRAILKRFGFSVPGE